MLAIKIAPIEWINSSRDKRELSVLRELGIEVLVVAKGKPEEHRSKKEIDGFPVLLLSTRPLGRTKFLVPLNRIISIFIWARTIRSLKADILSGRNIIGTWIALISTWFRNPRNRPVIVYDSHEMFSVWKENPSLFYRLGVYISEKVFTRKCAFTFIPNDAGADLLQKKYHLQERPVVVRSIPEHWIIDEKEVQECRKYYLDMSNGSNVSFLVIYHGMVFPNRGIEAMIEAVQPLTDVAAIILGDGSEEYINNLKDKVHTLGLDNRVIFHQAVNHSDLKNYLRAADVGVVAVKAKTKSYYYMLPNKFFENIQSENPVIVSDYPEVRNIVRKYNIGILIDPDSIQQLTKAILILKEDKALYETLRKNTVVAKEELCWENEKMRLKIAYTKALERYKENT